MIIHNMGPWNCHQSQVFLGEEHYLKLALICRWVFLQILGWAGLDVSPVLKKVIGFYFLAT